MVGQAFAPPVLFKISLFCLTDVEYMVVVGIRLSTSVRRWLLIPPLDVGCPAPSRVFALPGAPNAPTARHTRPGAPLFVSPTPRTVEVRSPAVRWTSMGWVLIPTSKRARTGVEYFANVTPPRRLEGSMLSTHFWPSGGVEGLYYCYSRRSGYLPSSGGRQRGVPSENVTAAG